MATVINTFPDRRAALLGKGLGTLVGNVLEARRKKEEERKRKEALSRAADLTKEIAQGSKTVDESDVAEALFDAGVDTSKIVTSFEAIAKARIQLRQREEDIKREQAIDLREQMQTIAGEGRAEARTKRTETRGEARTVRGEGRAEARTVGAERRGERRDISKETRGEAEDIRGEGREEEREESRFTRALKVAKIEEIKKGVDERLQNLEFGRILQEAGTGELDAEQMFNVIAAADLPPDLKFGLLDRLAKGELGLEVGEEFEDLKVFDLDSGRETTIKVPKDIAQGTRQQQDAFFKEKGFNITTQPQALITGGERTLKEFTTAAGGDDDPYVKKIIALRKLGLVQIDADNQGNQVITDLVSRKTSFVPSPIMDAVAARQVQFKISSIEDALVALDKIDITKVGLDDFFAAKIGGGGITLPIVGGIVQTIFDFWGLESSEIAEAQAARASFFATLAPIAKSIATEEGERNAISSPAAIELAKDIVLITNPTTTELGARIAVKRLKETLQGLKVSLMAQLQHRTMLRPRIIDVDLREEDGRFKVERRKSE